MFDGLLKNVKDAAQNIGQTLEEHNRQQQQQNQNADVEESIQRVDSQGGRVQVSSVQDTPSAPNQGSKGADFLAGLVNVAQDISKSLNAKNEQGGKAETTQKEAPPTTQSSQDQKGSDFLSGLVNVAQSIGASLEKSKTEGKTEPAPTEKPAANPSDSDLKVLGENIGSIVGNLLKKEEPKKEDEFKAEAVIDDIEGEIGKVTTTGYTAANKK